MAKLAVVYHSGYGHTQKVAEAVVKGVRSVQGTQVELIPVEALGSETAEGWKSLDQADGIIFGSPTYMGGVSGPFKTFIDATSVVWSRQGWKDKIAAGFTISGSYSGDKLNTLFQLMVNAMQHGMIWVSTGLMPGGDGKSYAGPEVVNRIGGSAGLMTQAFQDSPEITPPKGDLDTGELFGQRVAEITKQFVAGRRLEARVA